MIDARTIAAVGTPPSSRQEFGIFTQALFEQCLSARQRSQLLCERSRTLQERSQAILARCWDLHERSRVLREHSQSVLKRCDALGEQISRRRDLGDEPSSTGKAAAQPVQAPPRKRTRSKLVHKNRWLISVDVVASLRRAGVDCNILVPGGEPWFEAIGCDSHCRRH